MLGGAGGGSGYFSGVRANGVVSSTNSSQHTCAATSDSRSARVANTQQRSRRDTTTRRGFETRQNRVRAPWRASLRRCGSMRLRITRMFTCLQAEEISAPTISTGQRCSGDVSASDKERPRALSCVRCTNTHTRTHSNMYVRAPTCSVFLAGNSEGPQGRWYSGVVFSSSRIAMVRRTRVSHEESLRSQTSINVPARLRFSLCERVRMQPSVSSISTSRVI